MHQIGTQPANTSTHHTGHSKSLLAEAFFNLHLLCICTTDNLWTSEGSNGLMEGIFFTHPIFSPIHEPTSHTMQMQFDALHCMQENQNAFASRCTENFMHLNASASRCTEALMHPRLDAQVLDPSDPRSTLKNCQHPHFLCQDAHKNMAGLYYARFDLF